MSIELPKTKIKAEVTDPKNLIIFSKPKYGKSSACAALPNALCIDLEDGGYDYIDAMKVKVNSVGELKEVCKAIIEAGRPYKFIVLDTITRLEEMAKPLALKLFQATPAGAKFTGTIPSDTLRLLRDKILLMLDNDLEYHIKKWNVIKDQIEQVASYKGWELVNKYADKE